MTEPWCFLVLAVYSLALAWLEARPTRPLDVTPLLPAARALRRDRTRDMSH